jgi:hypothetical protein
MAIYGLAARALIFAASGPPSEMAIAATVLERIGRNSEAVRGGVVILNALDTIAELNKVLLLLKAISGESSSALAKEIVALQRERGPDDTFTLERGTDWRREGDEIVITASAVRRLTSGDSDDYAWFVERGTDDTEAQPYFWDSAAERFAAWGRDMDQILDTAAAEFNAG